MPKPSVQGNVPTAIRELYDSWKSSLKNKKHNGLLLSACIMIAANHDDERDYMFGQLAKADALGEVEKLLHDWVYNPGDDPTAPTMIEESKLKTPMSIEEFEQRHELKHGAAERERSKVAKKPRPGSRAASRARFQGKPSAKPAE